MMSTAEKTSEVDKVYLLLVNDARWTNALDVCSKGEERLDLFLRNVIWHDDRYNALSVFAGKARTLRGNPLASYPL